MAIRDYMSKPTSGVKVGNRGAQARAGGAGDMVGQKKRRDAAAAAKKAAEEAKRKAAEAKRKAAEAAKKKAAPKKAAVQKGGGKMAPSGWQD